MTKTGDTFFTNEMVDNVLVSRRRLLRCRRKVYANGHDLKDPLLSPVYGDMRASRRPSSRRARATCSCRNTVRVHRKLREAGVEAVTCRSSRASRTRSTTPMRTGRRRREHFAELTAFFDRHLGK